MAFLFIGGEECDFQPSAAWALDTTAAAFRPDYARAALRITTNGSDLSNPLIGALVTPANSLWMTLRVYPVSSQGGTKTLVAFYDSTRIRLALKLVSGALTLVGYNDSGTATTLATGSSLAAGSLQRLDIRVSFATSGGCDVYVERTQALTYSGDLKQGSTTATSLARFSLHNPGFSSIGISECIIADTDSRTLSLKTLTPAAAGGQAQWAGTYADVDDLTPSGTDFAYATAAERAFTVQANAAVSAGAFAIKAVKIAGVASAGETGPAGISLSVSADGATSYSGRLALDSNWNNVGAIFESNPSGSNWTVNQVASLEFGVKSKS